MTKRNSATPEICWFRYIRSLRKTVRVVKVDLNDYSSEHCYMLTLNWAPLCSTESVMGDGKAVRERFVAQVRREWDALESPVKDRR